MQALLELVKVQVRAADLLLIPCIDEHLLLGGDASEDRRDGKFHPSDLSGAFCPRAWSLYNFHPDGYRIKEGSNPPRIKRVFGNGNGVHARIQGYFQRQGILWGRYVNLRTGKEHVGFPTPGMNPDEWVYREIKIRHDEDNILGSNDGDLLFDGDKIGLEIKSMNSESFKWLQGPKAMHREQVLIYLHGKEWMRRMKAQGHLGGFVDEFDALPIKEFRVLYENKDNQELKEYPIPFDADEVELFMEHKRPLMHAALEYTRTRTHPSCRCGDRTSALCKALKNAA